MAQLAECLGAELPVDDMRCCLHFVHRRLPELAVGMLLQISIQEKGVHGQQAVQGVGGVCRNVREVAPDLFRKRRPAQGLHQFQHIFSCCIFGRLEKAGCRCIHCQSDSGNGQIKFPVPSYEVCNTAYIPFPEQVLSMTGNERASMFPFPLRLAAE
jgi:hypothetical protein